MPAVYIDIPIATVQEAEEKPSLTYRLDLDAGRIVGMVDGLEAVNQAIRKAILTPRFKCLIYDNQYGSEIEDAVLMKKATRAYIRSALEGFIRDCLKPDTRILTVRDVDIGFEEDDVYVTFKADTVFGETEIREVI
ncbi:MAG: DUF2634 domain-containing protein [Oscillibacter sp.]|nr:DUF2634 domain-containing protein [Oscillibacter sp.]